MTNAVKVSRHRNAVTKSTADKTAGNADTPEVNAATRDGGHLSRLESANPHGTTGGTRAQGSVKFVSASTGEHEDAGNPGEEDNNRGLSQPSADEVPNPRLAPPRRDTTRSRRDRDVSQSNPQSQGLSNEQSGTRSGMTAGKTRTDNEPERPGQIRYTLCSKIVSFCTNIVMMCSTTVSFFLI